MVVLVTLIMAKVVDCTPNIGLNCVIAQQRPDVIHSAALFSKRQFASATGYWIRFFMYLLLRSVSANARIRESHTVSVISNGRLCSSCVVKLYRIEIMRKDTATAFQVIVQLFSLAIITWLVLSHGISRGVRSKHVAIKVLGKMTVTNDLNTKYELSTRLVDEVNYLP